MGEAPDAMEVGGVLRISAEAAKRWRRDREAAAGRSRNAAAPDAM
jgi:hypothetical protein